MSQALDEGKCSYQGRSWIRLGTPMHQEVSRSHSTCQLRATIDRWRTHKVGKGRTLSCSKCCKDPPAGGSLTLGGTGKHDYIKMIEQILRRENLIRAMYKVQKNHGSAGVDHMPVTSLTALLSIDKEELTAKVRSGKYLPQPILGVEIPKGSGKTRMLGIPTVTDRFLQQAVLQVITARFEYEFSESSFGFRPKRNVQQAVQKAQAYINEGFQNIVDIDLKAFFDEVDHCYLLQLLYRQIKCRDTMRLIRKWLRSPIQINGKLVKRRKGVPQGSPLSPLLSNIMLHELDRELERQGLRFVRYADDFSIYLKTKAEAQRVGNNIYRFLKRELKLPINREKSGLRRPVHFTILGFGFVPTYRKGERGKYQLVVSDKSCPEGIPSGEKS